MKFSRRKLGKSMQKTQRPESHGSPGGKMSQEGEVGCQMLLSSVVRAGEK